TPQNDVFHFSSADPGNDPPISGHVTATDTSVVFSPSGQAESFHLGRTDFSPIFGGGATGYSLFSARSSSGPLIFYQGAASRDTVFWASTSFDPSFEIATAQPAAVPGPGTLTLALVGIGALAGARLTRRRQAAPPHSASPPARP